MTKEFVEVIDKVKHEILENPGIDLIEEGIIDSLDIMNLITELEKAFDVDFDPDDVTPETFSSAETVWEIIQKYEREKSDDAG